jgi:transcriptional regulator with XRE-family HTH domain
LCGPSLDYGKTTRFSAARKSASHEKPEETGVNIAKRLIAIRLQKKLTQTDLEERTGLLRVYISRVETGVTVPGVATLEKWARALEVPLYQLFYDGENAPVLTPLVARKRVGWGCSGQSARTFNKFQNLLSRMSEADRDLLLDMPKKMLQRKAR